MPDYVNNEELKAEILACKTSNSNPNVISNKLCRMLMKIVESYSTKGNWVGYTYRDEMVASAIAHLTTPGTSKNKDGTLKDPTPTALKFNPHAKTSALAYVTTCIYHCFCKVLNVEKESRNIRDDLLIIGGAEVSSNRQLQDLFDQNISTRAAHWKDSPTADKVVLLHKKVAAPFKKDVRFGKLVTIEEVKTNGDKLWKCRCDCGTVKDIKAKYLNNGNVKSCGCFRNLDLVGRKVGRLTVLEYKGVVNYTRTWWCRCDCGNERLVSTSNLTQEKVKSCGCIMKERKERKERKGQPKQKRAPSIAKTPRTGRPTTFPFVQDARYARLTTIADTTGNRRRLWTCRCDCGTVKDLFVERIVSGRTKSCGCLRTTLHHRKKQVPPSVVTQKPI